MLNVRALACFVFAVATGGCGSGSGTDGPATVEDLTMAPPPDLTGVTPPDLTGVAPPDLTGTPPGPDLMTAPAPDLMIGGAKVGATIRMIKTQMDPKTILCKDSGITAVDVTVSDMADPNKKVTTNLPCEADKFYVQSDVALPDTKGPFIAKAVTVGMIVASAELKDRPGDMTLAININLCDPAPNPLPAVCK